MSVVGSWTWDAVVVTFAVLIAVAGTTYLRQRSAVSRLRRILPASSHRGWSTKRCRRISGGARAGSYDRAPRPGLEGPRHLRHGHRLGFPRSMWHRIGMAAVVGAAVWIVLGGGIGLSLGSVASVLTAWISGRLQPEHDRERRAEAATWLPLAADLIGASLRAGSTPETALRVVAAAVPGLLGERLAQVSVALALGAKADEAWGPLADVPGAGALIRAGTRVGTSGAALDGMLVRVADQARLDLEQAATAAARSAGTYAVLPLGLCFLPAFVLLAVVPIIVSVLSGVLW